MVDVLVTLYCVRGKNFSHSVTKAEKILLKCVNCTRTKA